MERPWPSLPTLALFLAVVEEGSLGAGARRVGTAQPNASRAIAELEREMRAELLIRHPRGSRPTALGLAFAEHAREVLDVARGFADWAAESRNGRVLRLSVGASMTIAESLLPSWLARMRERVPDARVDVSVLNSTQVIDEVQEGRLQLGFIETPRVPVRLNARVVQEDELVLAVSPTHPWAHRTGRITRRELAETPLVVREPGSGTREALDDLLAGLDAAEPAHVLSSNAAVRVAVEAGGDPALLSGLALRDPFALGHLVRVPFEGSGVTRPLTAVWGGPRRLPPLVAIAAGSA